MSFGDNGMQGVALNLESEVNRDLLGMWDSQREFNNIKKQGKPLLLHHAVEETSQQSAWTMSSIAYFHFEQPDSNLHVSRNSVQGIILRTYCPVQRKNWRITITIWKFCVLVSTEPKLIPRSSHSSEAKSYRLQDRTKKKDETLWQDSQCPGRDLKPWLPESESGVMPT